MCVRQQGAIMSAVTMGGDSGPRPAVGRLAGGEPYYAPIGAMLYDGDGACCHLC